MTRDVRRVPVKLTGIDAKESAHLEMSFDGLTAFEPLDIYPEDITSTEGLLFLFGLTFGRSSFCSPSSSTIGWYC